MEPTISQVYGSWFLFTWVIAGVGEALYSSLENLRATRARLFSLLQHCAKQQLDETHQTETVLSSPQRDTAQNLESKQQPGLQLTASYSPQPNEHDNLQQIERSCIQQQQTDRPEHETPVEPRYSAQPQPNIPTTEYHVTSAFDHIACFPDDSGHVSSALMS